MVMWKNVKLDTLMRIETGNRNTEDRVEGAHYPFFVRSQEVERIDDYAYDCEAVLTAGDGVGTGKIFHYINGKFNAHQRVYVMSQFNGIDGKYFYYFFSRNFFDEVAKYTAKSSVDSVRRAMISDMIVPLPLLSEQRRIASSLSDVDGYIDVLEKLISKKRAIKQGTMQELLTGKRRLPGFSGEWESLNLASSSTLKARIGWQGLTTAEYLNEGYALLITGTDFKHGKINWNGCHYVEKSRYDQDTNIQINNGDILITKDGTIGKVAIVEALPKKATLNSGVFVVRPQNGAYVSLYVYYILLSDIFADFLAKLAAGSTISHLYQKDFVSFEFMVPPTKTEQIAVANILSDMDAEIDALTTKLNKAKQIKQGMMSELLTGRIRLLGQDMETTTKSVTTPKVVKLPKREPQANNERTDGHNQQFNDAVMIAGIVNALYSEKYPLGRKRVQKCLYLLRRYQDESTATFKKKAAGPYADEVRYKGGEPIAKRSNYIVTTTMKGKGTTFSHGNDIDKALRYIQKWGRQSDISWVVENLKYKKTDDLELVATVDMAICDLSEAGIAISIDTIKYLISTNEEWKAKLKKQTFSNENINRAIRELQTLLQRRS